MSLLDIFKDYNIKEFYITKTDEGFNIEIKPNSITSKDMLLLEALLRQEFCRPIKVIQVSELSG